MLKRHTRNLLLVERPAKFVRAPVGIESCGGLALKACPKMPIERG